MKHEFEWDEMSDREKQLWRALMRERQVEVDPGPCFWHHAFKFNLEIKGVEEANDHVKKLGEVLKEKFPNQCFASKENFQFNDVLDSFPKDAPFAIIYLTDDSFTICGKEVSAIQPVLDEIYTNKLSVVMMDKYFNYNEIGQQALKIELRESVDLTADYYKEEGLNR